MLQNCVTCGWRGTLFSGQIWTLNSGFDPKTSLWSENKEAWWAARLIKCNRILYNWKGFFFTYLPNKLYSKTIFTKYAITRQSLPKRQDGAIQAIRGSYLGCPEDSWEKQPTINYLGMCPRKAATNLPRQSAHQHCGSVRKKVKPDELLDAPLFCDIDMLSDILSDIVDWDNPVAHDLYERFQKHSQNLGRQSKWSRASEVHHRLRNLRRSELEAALDTEQDGDNESLSEKSIRLLPMVEYSVRGTFDKIMKQKQKEGMSIAENQKFNLWWFIGAEGRGNFDGSSYRGESTTEVNQISVQSFE